MLPRLRPWRRSRPEMVSALLVPRNSSTACFVARIELEFTVQSVTGSATPDPQTVAARGNFGVAVQCLLEHELGPAFDRTGRGVAAMIEIDRSQSVQLRQNIGDAVAVSGLHSGQRRGVTCPGIGIRYAGVPRRLRRHEGRLLPVTVRPWRPPPYCPLRPLKQRRQGARQLRKVGLIGSGLRGNRFVAHCTSSF